MAKLFKPQQPSSPQPPQHIPQNQPPEAVEVSKRVQFTDEYPDGEIPVLSQEDFANLSHQSLDPVQEQEERERRKLRDEADKALQELDEARKKEDGSPYHRLSMQSYLTLAQTNEYADRALRELDEARKESPRIPRRSPNRQSVDYKLPSSYSPIPLKHSKSSDVPLYTHVPTEQIPYEPQMSEEELRKQFGRERNENRENEVQRERSDSERVKPGSNKINHDKVNAERKRSPSFPPHSGFDDKSRSDYYDREFHEMTKYVIISVAKYMCDVICTANYFVF